MPRLFIGLEIPDPVKHQLLSLTRDISGARWQTADQLHLTVCFIGTVDEAMTNTIKGNFSWLKSLAPGLQLQGAQCFGPATRPRNLWVAVTPEEPLASLHHEVCGRLQAIGLNPDRRHYRPHITLARFGRQAGSVEAFLADCSDLTSDTFTINQLSLFESTQGQDGSRYQVIGRFPLAHRGAQTC